MTEAEEKIFQEAILKWGAEGQIEMIIEEMAELTVAIQHWKRGRVDTEKIADELSDVGIMVDQLSLMLDPDPEASKRRYLRYREMKINRLDDRIADRGRPLRESTSVRGDWGA
jgi:NTP pyrophosphatase (non-canonical NTP hydrolase)